MTRSVDSINLPGDIKIMDYIGKGNRAQVYSAMIDGVEVVVKVYHKRAVKKYKEKYKVDIAEHEFQRNQSLYDLEEIREHIAKPCRLYSEASEYTQCIIQERVYGETLEQLINRLKYLPDKLLQSGRQIVRVAEKNNIHDLDISVGNVRAKEESGEWKLTLYDFNIMPQYLFPPNPFMGLGFKLGIRKKSFRDYRSLRNWDRRGKQKWWIGRN